VEGQDDLPSRGSLLVVINTTGLFEKTTPLTESLARLIESGLSATFLVDRGAQPIDRTGLYADSYTSQEEMSDAIIAEIGKLDVNPAPRPKGAPPLERGEGLERTPDIEAIQQFLASGTVVLFSNDMFKAVPCVRDLIWSRDVRLQFRGG